MAINLIAGIPGSGKSYVAVNEFLRQWLENSNRPIFTNLPLAVDEAGMFEVVKASTRNQAKRVAYAARIHLLKQERREVPSWKDPETGEERPASVRDTLREFWYFTPPGAVIMLDELADIYPATGKGEAAPEMLGHYFRLHRHLKHDFYGFVQSKADVVAQLRRLVSYVFVITNSVKENMFDWWALRGVKWPVQFFRVRAYVASQVMDSPTLENVTVEPQEAFLVWPNKRGFRNYHSFSRVGCLPWAQAPADIETGDINQSWHQRTAGFMRQLPVLVAIVAALGIAGWYGWRGLAWLRDPKSAKAFHRPVESAVLVATNSVVQAKKEVETEAQKVMVAADETEKLVLVTPELVRTTRGEYRVGDEMGGVVIARILLDGIVSADGSRRRWAVVLRRGGRGGSDGGNGDLGTVGGVGVAEGGSGEP